MFDRLVRGAVFSGSVIAFGLMSAAAFAQETQYHPAFCQGMSIEGGDNRMFLSRTFAYPQKRPPESGTLQEGSAGAEFAREVKRRSGKELLDAVCYTRATAEELETMARSTAEANGSGWTVETLEWRPKGARVLTAEAEAEQPASEPRATAPVSAAALEAKRAAEAERIAAEERASARVREINAQQLQAAEEQTRKNEAAKRAHEAEVRAAQERERAYQEEQRAYARGRAEYEARVRASEAAHRQWEADVAACKSGDRSKCAPQP